MQAVLHDYEVMGTVFRFTFDKSQVELVLGALPQAKAIIEEADQRFSAYKPDSEVSRIQSGDLAVGDASYDTREIWKQCHNWQNRTEGGFQATTPEGKWDPSGIVKGWVAQGAVNYLAAAGLANFSLNAGGDVLLSESVDPALGRVGISAPVSIAISGFKPELIIDLTSSIYRAVATSGIAERGEHIWSRSHSIIQATVVAQDLVTADVWATAVVAKGIDLIPTLSELGIPVMIWFSDGSRFANEAFEQLSVNKLKMGA
jgi:thiamine biosynthesis lipoprotein